VRAQPRTPIRIVVGFPPGGGTDFVARALASEIAEPLGRTVVVENRPGAGSNIASEVVARAVPDGTTLLLGGNFSHAINPHLYRHIAFAWDRDFTPVSRLNAGPFIFAVRQDSPFRSLAEVIAHARANPGRLNYASSGNGSPQHLGGAWLARRAAFEWTHIPYRGGAPALMAALSGEVDLVVASVAVLGSQEGGGRLRVLSSSIGQRWPSIPEVPSIAENGVPEFDLLIWLGLWLPAGATPAVLAPLFAAVRDALGRESLLRAMQGERLTPAPSPSPEAFAEFVRRENALWRDLVRASGAIVE
jgi:tripartite-type tricarboxylate transporter receptor subunit TctC